MEFRHLLLLSALSCLGLIGNIAQASLHAEIYWQTVWPKTPMPTVLKDLIQPGDWSWTKSKKTHLNKAELINPAACFSYTYRPGCPPPSSKNTVFNGTYFLEHDLQKSTLFTTMLTKHSNESTLLLPESVAKTIPFSSSRIPEILSRFNFEANSTDAETLKQTLDLCESPAMNEEKKYCATSLESLVKFAISQLGKDIRIFSGKFEKGKTEEKQLRYNLVEGVKKIGEKVVVCHKLNYPYAVFYCHKINTRAYIVSLVEISDRTKTKALAVCHTDTREWNGEHPAFKMLNVKPGTVSICHFLTFDTLLWTAN